MAVPEDHTKSRTYARPFRDRRCPAVATAPEGTVRCDLRYKHKGDHSAEHGMYSIAWSPHTATEGPIDIEQDRRG